MVVMVFICECGLLCLWLLGWLFGIELVLKYGREYDIEGVILFLLLLYCVFVEEVVVWVGMDVFVVVFVFEFDDYLCFLEVCECFVLILYVWLIVVEGGKYLWVGEI